MSIKSSKLVNLFIVGSIKCGTSSLYSYLNSHPKIYFSDIKEPRFFNISNFKKSGVTMSIPKKRKHFYQINSLIDYHNMYPFNNKKYKYFGDASPTYFSDKTAFSKIYNYNKNSKIIILKRDPIDRLVSHYKMEKNVTGFECDDINEAIYYEIKGVIKPTEKSYIENSLFNKHIDKYITRFGKKSVLVVEMDNLKNQTLDTLEKIFDFLDLDFDKNLNVYKIIHNKSYDFKYEILNKFFKNKRIKIVFIKLFPRFLKDYLKNRFKSDLKSEISSKNLKFLKTIFKSDLDVKKK